MTSRRSHSEADILQPRRRGLCEKMMPEPRKVVPHAIFLLPYAILPLRRLPFWDGKAALIGPFL